MFGDEEAELISETVIDAGQPYGLQTEIDLSTAPTDGSPRHMRIIGDYALVSPCLASVGEALDLRVVW